MRVVLNQQNSNRSEEKEGQERGIALVISGGNSSKPLDFLEETLDQMALLVQMPVYWPRLGNVALWRDRVAGPMLRDINPNGSGAISPVCQYAAPADLDFFQQFNSVDAIIVIPGGEEELHRIPQTVHDGMDLRIRPAFGTPYCLIRRFFPHRWRFRVPSRM